MGGRLRGRHLPRPRLCPPPVSWKASLSEETVLATDVTGKATGVTAGGWISASCRKGWGQGGSTLGQESGASQVTGCQQPLPLWAWPEVGS